VNKTDAIEKIIDGYAAIDRTLMLSGIGLSDEQHIAAARAELAALRAENERLSKEKQDEFDIASGYYKRWQAVAAENAARAEEIDRIRGHATAARAEWQECVDCGGHWDRVRVRLDEILVHSVPASSTNADQARKIAALREALRKAWCLLDVAEHNDPVTEEAFRILSSYGTNDL